MSTIRCPDCQAINERRRAQFGPDVLPVREFWPDACPYAGIHERARMARERREARVIDVPKQGNETTLVEGPLQATQRIETIDQYMLARCGKMWTEEDTDHVLHHIRQVEATWAAIAKLATDGTA